MPRPLDTRRNRPDHGLARTPHEASLRELLAANPFMVDGSFYLRYLATVDPTAAEDTLLAILKGG